MPKLNPFKEKFKNNSNGLLPSPYDKRDYKFKDLVPVGAFQIPNDYVSPNLIPPEMILDQGNSNMCCACAFSYIRYMQESKQDQSEINQLFSPTFTYGNRLPGERFEGMYMRSCCKKAKQDGSLPISVLSGFYSFEKCETLVNKNLNDYKKLAAPFKISSYYQCNSRKQIQMAIMETGAVLCGIWVYDCLYSPEKITNIVRYNPNKHIRNDGGHAVTIVGWKNVRGRLYWKLLNSWGKEWGDNGYAWIPETYPFVEPPIAIVDNITEIKWKKYKEDNNLK